MMGGMSYIPKAWKKKVKRLYRKLKGSSTPRLDKPFCYQTMRALCSYADKLEQRAEKLHGDQRKQALEGAKYFRDLAKEISDLL